MLLKIHTHLEETLDKIHGYTTLHSTGATTESEQHGSIKFKPSTEAAIRTVILQSEKRRKKI